MSNRTEMSLNQQVKGSVHGAMMLLVASMLCFGSSTARAQILYVTNPTLGSASEAVSEYNAATGALINPSFITGLGFSPTVAVSGSDVYVVQNYNGSTIGEYNAVTGALLNSSFVSGLQFPDGMIVSGTNLFVTEATGAVAEFNANTGVAEQTFSSDHINGVGATVYGNTLYADVNGGGGYVAEFNATTGALINPTFIAGNYFMTVSGTDLVVVAANKNSQIEELDPSTGAAVGNSLGESYDYQTIAASGTDVFYTFTMDSFIGEVNTVSGVDNFGFATDTNGPYSLAYSSLPAPAPVPEPGLTMLALCGLGAVVTAATVRRSRDKLV